MDLEYISYQKDSNKYIAEKIFIYKKPGSKIILSTVKELKKTIKEKPLKGNNIINYSDIEKIDGSYYLLYKGENYLKPLIDKIDNGDFELADTIKWLKQLIIIGQSIDQDGFRSLLKLNDLRLDQNNNLYIVKPELNREVEQYKYKGSTNQYDDIYLPPEVLKGENSDQSSKIYNFGVIFYYLLTGKFPFQANNKKKMYDKKMTGSLLAPKYLNPQISKTLNNLVVKMLKVNKKNRFSSFNELLKKTNKIINTDNYKANIKEVKKNKRIAKKQKNRLRYKEKFLFFFRNHWGKTLLVLILVASLSYAFSLGNSPPNITQDTPPDQVVRSFYQAIDQKTPILLNETTNQNLKKLDTMVSEGYVIETMRTAFQNSEQSEENKELFGIKNLEIKKNEYANYLVYDSRYVFFYQREDQIKEVNMTDYLKVNKVDNKWQITEIKGSIVSLIEGKFEG
ncbi:MAG: protein kinase [Halanaerobiales bacterium]|nr:protein kinase [Halanaerobiales bacterium]